MKRYDKTERCLVCLDYKVAGDCLNFGCPSYAVRRMLDKEKARGDVLRRVRRRRLRRGKPPTILQYLLGLPFLWGRSRIHR